MHMRRAHRRTVFDASSRLTIVLILAGVACATHGRTGARAPVTREGFVGRADGVRLFYRISGHGDDALVVVHGGPGLDRGYLQDDLQPLARTRSVVFYDQRGSGRSTGPSDTTAFGLDAHIADLEAIRAHLGIDRMAVTGHSWGALVAAAYAVAHPTRVSRLVLITPPPPTRGRFWEQFRSGIARRTDSALMARQGAAFSTTSGDPLHRCREAIRLVMLPYFRDTATMRRMRGTWCDAPGDALGTTMRTMRQTWAAVGEWNLTPLRGSLPTPTLVVQGSEDVVPADAGNLWVAAVPHGRLLVMPHAGHYPWLDAPRPFFRALDDFLDGRWPENAIRPAPP
jgi:proline iminopeptidase